MASNRYVQFAPAVIEQARQIDLLSYLQRYEPSNLKRVAGNVYCTNIAYTMEQLAEQYVKKLFQKLISWKCGLRLSDKNKFSCQ